MVAVAAAGVAAAASVAAAGVQASSKGKGGGGPQMQGMNPWERIFNRATADINDEERRVMEDSIAQANFLQPEMYALLGYEPIYDDNIDAGQLKQLGDAADGLRRAQQEGKEVISGNRVTIKETRQQLRKLKGKKNKAKRQELKQSIREMTAEIKTAKQQEGPLQKEAAAAQQALSDAQTSPRRVIGFKKREGGAVDPTGDPNYTTAFRLQNEALVRALKGEEPVDATLRTAWDEREATLRERLRRQLGPDYETSTAGADALANFDRERNENFSAFNRQLVGELSGETESRAASLSNLTSSRMQQLLYPSNTQAARALQLGQVAGDRMAIAQHFQHERLAQFEGKAASHAADSAAAQDRSQAIASLINQAGQGVGASGPTLDRYLGNGGAAQPDTVDVPTY
jgi:hypothetical protein